MKKALMTIFVVTVGLGLFNHSACGIFKYTIVGDWTLSKVVNGEVETMTLTFMGDRNSGSVIWNDFIMGPYRYSNSILTFSMSYGSNVGYGKVGTESYVGAFDDKDLTSGDFTADFLDETYSGTWTAER